MQMKRVLFASILALSLALFAGVARAEVKPYPLCTDGMVLQQQTDAKLWGTADTGEVVTVTFRGKQASATAGEGGRWVVTIAAGEAGGPFELTIVGKNTLTYKNVLVGEVWLCSGQSNMDWGLNSCDESDKAYANTAPSNAMLRLFTTFAHRDAGATTHGPAGVWVEANAKTIYGFSAVGYFFGRSLQEHCNVPVGLIHASNGGSAIQQWMSPSAVAPLNEKPNPGFLSSVHYNRLIQPLLDCRLRGVIWYQGCSNRGEGEAPHYRALLTTLIESWRSEFHNADLAFHIVQIAPNESAAMEVREAQTLTALLTRNTGTAVSYDYGDESDIHPNPKRPVGERLALAARGITYGEKIVYSGPMIKTVTFDGPRAILGFDHVGGGLISQELVATTNRAGRPTAWRVKAGTINATPLVGFSLCGKDERFQPAQAEIVGDTVVVTSSGVAVADGVRYGWANLPNCNLYNREGLPTSPFRSYTMVAALKLSAGAGGTIFSSNVLLAAKGMAIPIRATPAPNHVFTGWTVLSGAAEFADPKAAETTVRVTDDSALQANFSLCVVCAVTEPATPTLVKVGSKVKLAATASILQGSSKVRKVEFFRENVKIGEAAANPYACTWPDVQAGSHTVTARATDSGGLVATSAPVYVVATASGAWEGIHATGGTVAYYTEGGTNWTAHVFTNSGVLNVKAAGEVEYLVVGGGGGGGGTYESGGGGAGGVRTGAMTLPAGTYTITVGNGGNGSLQGGLPASNGGPSSLSNGLVAVKALGGGYGGSSAGGYGGGVAGDGGSGGGGMWSAKVPGKAVGGVGELGHDGGLANAASGGGGAGGVGQNANPAAVRDGGPGWVSTLRDGSTVVTYAAGGVGRVRPGNNLFAVVDVRSKADNTGDGGDGGSSGNGSAKGGNGGSGIVIVRYVTGGK
jgi:sialate O-acetylesterase